MVNTPTVHTNIEQGSDEWLQLRCGMLTASTIGSLITPARVKVAENDTARTLIAHLAAERITGHVEPTYVSADMERGTFDEPYARDLYTEHYGAAIEVGFMTNVFDGHTLGYSPDGLVGDDGLIEIKSRRQKKHLQTILADAVPLENMAQIQTGLLVSGRAWCDYISFCGGMPLYVKRVHPDPKWHETIRLALTAYETQAAEMIATFTIRTKGAPIPERVDHFADMELS
ncbi:YqaJ viral recombinase family protein [Curtobacterium flaccumfaciens pv. flaccumfaciens]|uniref:YqaJ viral recombinase family protein n=1 Tax=Curtobacterium flaccumfaciens pv. flaccumfaciens TaxID=138532 RepID=A0A9Q2W7L9_9MICO|nr:lambda exonuclease family protein [Curtobacterium flaccumfaciens]MBT1542448.1 YqaJ viral recombinase family protein [Curtobacterium flaccumfaciens pv. flaccumfaciens]